MRFVPILLTLALCASFSVLGAAESSTKDAVTRMAPAPALRVEWKPELYKNRLYVPMEQVAAYYNLKAPKNAGKDLILITSDPKPNAAFRIDLTRNERRVKLNSWTFYFSYPVITLKDKVMISAFDVRNVLDPIMRPGDRRDPALLRTVILDAAGGGSDTGIKSPFITESELTMETAKVLAVLLKNSGYQVVLTRDGDKTVSAETRARIANEVNDESIFITLHASSGSPKTKGVECSTLPPAGTPATNEEDADDIDKRFFPGNISDRESLALAATLQNSIVRATKTVDIGVRRVRLGELRDVRHPAVICRLGFLSNREEAKQLATEEYRMAVATAISQGVDRYAAHLRGGMAERTEEDRTRPLRLGAIEAKNEPGGVNLSGETITLKVPVLPADNVNIDRSRVELQVFLFETVNGGELDITTADPPKLEWLSVLPDWKNDQTESLQATYVRPAFTPAEQKQYGKRAYYGYVVRLAYDGRLMDEAAWPRNLNRGLYHFTPVFPKR